MELLYYNEFANEKKTLFYINKKWQRANMTEIYKVTVCTN